MKPQILTDIDKNKTDISKLQDDFIASQTEYASLEGVNNGSVTPEKTSFLESQEILISETKRIIINKAAVVGYTLLSDTYLNRDTGLISTLAGYTTSEPVVLKHADKLFCYNPNGSTSAHLNLLGWVVFFDIDNTFISSVVLSSLPVESYGGFEGISPQIPPNATSVRFCFSTNRLNVNVSNIYDREYKDVYLLKMENVEDSSPVYLIYDHTNSVINVVSHYSETKDIVTKLGRGYGANNLMSFMSWGLSDAYGIVVNPNHIATNNLLTVSTDMFAPYQIKAVNNIDGDFPSNTYFTGGVHGNQNNISGLPTARTDSIKVRINGYSLTSDFRGYCQYVDIEWINYVQGSNTQKADGTGREILREKICLHFDGIKWDVQNEITALEELTMSLYYGLQSPSTSGVYSKIHYIGSKVNRAPIALSGVGTNNGDKNCYDVCLFGDGHAMRFGINPNYDLGDLTNQKNAYSAFTSTLNKAYFSLISDTGIALSSGDKVYFEGYYMLYPTDGGIL